MSKHNKKRNVGIIYELLLRHISSNVIEEKEDATQNVMTIIKRHFKPGSELYKEFRLFNALIKTTVPSSEVASTILGEARVLARSIDKDKLNVEKTRLIHSINHNLQKESFYKRHVPDYRMYATIQTLLNDWRQPSEHRDFARMAKYEEKVRNWLMEEKQEIILEDQKEPDIDALVVRIMSEKMSKKYHHILNEQQKDILRAYILYSSNNDFDKLREYLEEMRVDTLQILDEYLLSTKNAVLNEKADIVRNDLLTVSTSEITDKTISRFLTIAHLKHTLLEEEKQ